MFKSLVKWAIIVEIGTAALFPVAAHALGASYISKYLTLAGGETLFQPPKAGEYVHTDQLKKLYSLRAYESIWVGAGGAPNKMAQTLRNFLLTADRHGLNVEDYWSREVENLYQATSKDGTHWLAFEMVASEALIRFVTHLSVGRFDPQQVDTDIHYKAKSFNEYSQLSAAVAYGPESLASELEGFTPSYPRYKRLMTVLAKLRDMKAAGGWVTLESPGRELKLGSKHALISRLRKRFTALGYQVSDAGGDLFDKEFEQTLKKFQAANGVVADGTISAQSEVLRSLNYTVDQRISQVEVTMEKLRWLPRVIETRHIFVNLAMTEFELFNVNGERELAFKTVNGQPFRRTPSMRDTMSYVLFNAKWTVPKSIAIKDKLPLLRKDRNYLKSHNMELVYDTTFEPVPNPERIDWKNMTAENFRYYIRQGPGPENALGVVKFPLNENQLDIYLHDTNEPDLFGQSKRLRSSGCVRLEKPLDLAATLLADQGWDRQLVESIVPTKENYFVGQETKINLTKTLPVYLIYLTADVTDDDAVRFVEDVYGQDTRLAKALANTRRNSGETF